MHDPLRASLAEQLRRMRGDEPPAELLAVLLDVVREEVRAGGEELTLLRPRDWDELRHQLGAEGGSAPYWAHAWPSGLALADALAARDLAGARVLEIGCGLAVPSLVAGRRGASVLATDGAPEAVVFAAHAFALNDVVGELGVADWREADALLERAPWDLVLAADVLYLPENVDALLRVLPELIGSEGEALVADPQRAGGRNFAAAARRIFRVETRRDAERPSVDVHRLRPRALA